MNINIYANGQHVGIQDGAATCAQVYRLSVVFGIYSISSGILLLELCMDTHE